MIGTLLRHEAIRTRGFLLVIAAAATGLAGLGSLMAMTGWPVIATFGTVIGFVGALGLVPAIQLAHAVDFWRSGFGRIGYFTQTLPVRGSRIYAAKLVWAAAVLLLALVATLVLGFVVMLASAGSLFGLTAAQMVAQVGETLAAAFEASPWLVGLGAPLLLVALYAFNTVLLFAAATIGSERWLQRLGWGGPVLVWFALYAAAQALMFVLVLAVPFGIGADGSGGVGVVPVDLIGAMVHDTQLQLMPIGFVPAILAAIPVLIWASVRSWDHKVSLA
ncbi:hypothetical protein AA0Z99_11870 [Agrococcus sp. 1P02AA]|uniref:hypothetical protein n=1 Tax=Agrococcus sp. 1P02AA TaxID=3132259 RepID=UPI0039A4EE63